MVFRCSGVCVLSLLLCVVFCIHTTTTINALAISSNERSKIRTPPPRRVLYSYDYPIVQSTFSSPIPMVNRARFLNRLTDMGYTEEEAKEALVKQDWNLHNAADYLSSFSNPGRKVVSCIGKDVCFGVKDAGGGNQDIQQQQVFAETASETSVSVEDLVHMHNCLVMHRFVPPNWAPQDVAAFIQSTAAPQKQEPKKKKQDSAEAKPPVDTKLRLVPVTYPKTEAQKEEELREKEKKEKDDALKSQQTGSSAAEMANAKVDNPRGVAFGKLPETPVAGESEGLEKKNTDPFIVAMRKKIACAQQKWKAGPPTWLKKRIMWAAKQKMYSQRPVTKEGDSLPQEAWPSIVPVKVAGDGEKMVDNFVHPVDDVVSTPLAALSRGAPPVPLEGAFKAPPAPGLEPPNIRSPLPPKHIMIEPESKHGMNPSLPPVAPKAETAPKATF